MRIAITSCLALLALGAAHLAQADEFEEVRERIRDALIEQNLPSIAVAVARDDKVLWEEGFGWADMTKKIPATADTVYSLASISKPFTATGLMVLVERGKIDLDAPIDRYLGSARLTARVGDAKDATVRRVANHTSGLSVYYQFFYEDENVPLPSMEQSIRHNGILTLKPGEAMVYSNFGYGLLEYAIEQISRTSYARFMRKEVFEPLGLASTSINRDPDFGSRFAVRYQHGAVVPFYDFDHRGASAVFCSAHDLVRFAMFHLGQPVMGQTAVLRSASLQQMHTATAHQPDSDYGYGIGWGSARRLGVSTVGHSGGMGGVSTRLTLVPEANIAIVLLSNADADLMALQDAILHVLLPQTIRAGHGLKPTPELMGSWRGAVQTAAGPIPLKIDIESNGSVFAQVGEHRRGEVEQVSLSAEGVLWLEEVPGDLGTSEAARYPYRLQFALKARGPILNGAASAISRPLQGRVGNAITYFAELRKSPPAK